jgi:hypothetical protein
MAALVREAAILAENRHPSLFLRLKLAFQSQVLSEAKKTD